MHVHSNILDFDGALTDARFISIKTGGKWSAVHEGMAWV